MILNDRLAVFFVSICLWSIESRIENFALAKQIGFELMEVFISRFEWL